MTERKFYLTRTQSLEIPAAAALEPQLADLLRRMLAKVIAPAASGTVLTGARSRVTCGLLP